MVKIGYLLGKSTYYNTSLVTRNSKCSYRVFIATKNILMSYIFWRCCNIIFIHSLLDIITILILFALFIMEMVDIFATLQLATQN